MRNFCYLCLFINVAYLFVHSFPGNVAKCVYGRNFLWLLKVHNYLDPLV